MDKYLRENRDLWDDLTPLHAASDFYAVERFKQGRCTLSDVDRSEVGPVAGKRLLHLQCHFGLDTLSWARLGAEVVGTDFSERAIEQARSLAAELALPAEFVCCDLYDLPEHLSGEFDIAFTSEGVLCWLPDLKRWAAVIAHFLRRDGLFFIREFHPVAGIFDSADGVTAPVVHHPYFHSDDPMRFQDEDSYAAKGVDIQRPSYEWTHSMADIINALIGVGLTIEYVNEFPYCTYQSHPFLTMDEDGLWRFEEAPDSLPLMFSIRATKHA